MKFLLTTVLVFFIIPISIAQGCDGVFSIKVVEVATGVTINNKLGASISYFRSNKGSDYYKEVLPVVPYKKIKKAIKEDSELYKKAIPLDENNPYLNGDKSSLIFRNYCGYYLVHLELKYGEKTMNLDIYNLPPDVHFDIEELAFEEGHFSLDIQGKEQLEKRFKKIIPRRFAIPVRKILNVTEDNIKKGISLENIADGLLNAFSMNDFDIVRPYIIGTKQLMRMSPMESFKAPNEDSDHAPKSQDEAKGESRSIAMKLLQEYDSALRFSSRCEVPWIQAEIEKLDYNIIPKQDYRYAKLRVVLMASEKPYVLTVGCIELDGNWYVTEKIGFYAG